MQPAKRYHGKPCKKCGGTERYTSNRTCVPCSRADDTHRRLANPEAARAVRAAWRQANPEASRAATAAWKKANPEADCAQVAKRRASQLQRTPPWADLSAIKAIYLSCPSDHHVDHIVPLQGHTVCGLHVHYNLQHLPARENTRKGNHFEDTP